MTLVTAAASGLGLVNLAVLIINQLVFLERPLADGDFATISVTIAKIEKANMIVHDPSLDRIHY